MDKKTLLDIAICLILGGLIAGEIVFGFKLLETKWAKDTELIIEQSAAIGKNIGLVDSVFSWDETPYPDDSGDIVAIDENKFKINGKSSNTGSDSSGYVYYSSVDDSNASHYIEYSEVLDSGSVSSFHDALGKYFEGDLDVILPLLPVQAVDGNIKAYQQTFTDGAIPVLYDAGSGQYIMLLDCISSYYVLTCDEPFIVSDARVTMHYGNAADDPLTEHAWSTYEAGAIDNTRRALLDEDAALGSYTDPGTVTTNTNQNGGGSYTDSNGDSYTPASEVAESSALYVTPEDDAARELLVSYGSKTFSEDGTADDGSGAIDISSTSAVASQWVLTETQYSYTDYGITLNGLSGRRTSTLFEINGSASNTISAARPWVLCIKFMGEDNKLLGVKVIDNRSNPIPADGVSDFTMQLGASDNIEFSDIVAVQFAVH